MLKNKKRPNKIRDFDKFAIQKGRSQKRNFSSKDSAPDWSVLLIFSSPKRSHTPIFKYLHLAVEKFWGFPYAVFPWDERFFLFLDSVGNFYGIHQGKLPKKFWG